MALRSALKYMYTFTVALGNIVLAAVIGHHVTHAALPLLSPVPLKPSAVIAPEETVTASSKAMLDISPLLNVHLFGHTRAAPVIQTPLNPPDTKLNLELKGVLFSDDPYHAKAVIGQPGGIAEPFSAGSPISGGAVLYEIHPDRVILQRGSRYETLRLQDRDTDKSKLLAPAQTRPAAADSAEKLADYRRQIMAKPESMAEFIRVNPVYEQNGFSGYVLQPGNKPEVFREFGLQPGDRLTAVNGVILDSPMKGLDVLQQLATARRVQLELMRNGRPVSLPLNIQD